MAADWQGAWHEVKAARHEVKAAIRRRPQSSSSVPCATRQHLAPQPRGEHQQRQERAQGLQHAQRQGEVDPAAACRNGQGRRGGGGMPGSGEQTCTPCAAVLARCCLLPHCSTRSAHLHIHPAPVQLVTPSEKTNELAPQMRLTRTSWESCGQGGARRRAGRVVAAAGGGVGWAKPTCAPSWVCHYRS